MTPAEAVSATERGTEGGPGGLAPLHLGDPQAPVFSISAAPVPHQADVTVAARGVRLGDLGLIALRDWLDSFLAKPYDSGAPELWTASGIAKEERVALRTVYLWKEKADFPEPYAHPVGGYPVWEASRVRAWVLARPQGGPGRPPNKAIRQS